MRESRSTDSGVPATGASWINQVERFFALLTEKQIRRGVHRSTAQLEADIRAFIDAHNANPKPFRWTKSADDILAVPDDFYSELGLAKLISPLRLRGMSAMLTRIKRRLRAN